MSKQFEPPVNPNYCATVIRIKKLVPLPNADRLLGLPLFGLQAIVGKDNHEGDLGILFPSEVQLSTEFCYENDMFRHSEQNRHQDVVGYTEDNRRVRAIKLRGNRSDALFLPLSSLAFTGADLTKLEEGDSFDKLNGHDVCQKYVIRVREPRFQQPKKRFDRVDARLFPQHFDSEHWLRNEDRVDNDATLIITQKLHGTSIRVGRVSVKRKLSLVERVAKLFGAKVQETEYDDVFGSRKVVKDANNPNQDHFYDSDLWTLEGAKLSGVVPENFVVYGELIGWTEGGAPIQKHYTYDCHPGTRKLYVYRISTVNNQGVVADLSWDSVKEFCNSAGLLHVPELGRVKKSRFISGVYVDRSFVKEQFPAVDPLVPLSDDSPCDEGVCIRIEGLIPQIYKLKSPIFLGHETEMLDAGEEDIDGEEYSSTDRGAEAGEREKALI